MVAEVSAQQFAVAVEVQNGNFQIMSGCDMVARKDCDLANQENRSNEKDPAQQIASAGGEKISQEKISASETFWQEAFEMERQKNSCGETSDQGQRSSDEALLPAGNQDALEEKENEVREFTTRSESSGGGSQAPKPPCKGFMQKCKEMVAGYLAPSTSSTRNDHPGPEGSENQEGVAANDPEPNLGEGEFSPKTSELQISPLSSGNKTQEGEQNAGKTPVFRNAFDFEDEDIDPGMPPQVEGPIWPAGSNIFQNTDQPEGGTEIQNFMSKEDPIFWTRPGILTWTREKTPPATEMWSKFPAPTLQIFGQVF